MQVIEHHNRLIDLGGKFLFQHEIQSSAAQHFAVSRSQVICNDVDVTAYMRLCDAVETAQHVLGTHINTGHGRMAAHIAHNRVVRQVISLIALYDLKAVGRVAQFTQTAAKAIHAATVEFHVARDNQDVALPCHRHVHESACDASALNLVLSDKAQTGRLRDV